MKLYGYVEDADSDSPSVRQGSEGHNGGTPHVHLEFLRPNQAGTKFIPTKNVHIPLVD